MANFSRDSKGEVKPFEYSYHEKLEIFSEYCPFTEHFEQNFYCSMVEEYSISKLLKERISINYDVVKYERFKDTK